MSNIKFVVPRIKGDEDKFAKYVEPSVKKINCQLIQVNDDPNLPPSTIFKKYNNAMIALKQNALQPDDIIVFMHSDVGIIDNHFDEKIRTLFAMKPDIGLVGIAGTSELTDNGMWWANNPNNLRGHLIQGKDGGVEGEGYYLQKGPIGYFDDLVAIDGCMMITQGKYILDDSIHFDDVTFDGHNDMYDIDLCFSLLEKGMKIAIADILLFHRSMGKGSLGDKWMNAKTKLFDKWKAKGYNFPMSINSFEKRKNAVIDNPVQPTPESNKIIEIEI